MIADVGGNTADLGFDLYVQEMQNGEIVGIIYMGDLYTEVFMDMDDGTIEPDPSLDAYETLETIYRYRLSGRWPVKK